MAELSYREAVAYGIAQEMRRDPSLVMLGEDIAAAGGVFKTTVGLVDEFGPDRVRDTPISEQAILGAAMGAAMTGVPVIAEIMFSDFLAVCWDIVANEIAKSRYMTNGQVSFPLVIRTANGGANVPRKFFFPNAFTPFFTPTPESACASTVLGTRTRRMPLLPGRTGTKTLGAITR